MKTYTRIRLEFPQTGLSFDGEILAEDANRMYEIMLNSENSPAWLKRNRKKKCSYADQYKGIHPPKCNNGDPCEACQKTYEANQ